MDSQSSDNSDPNSNPSVPTPPASGDGGYQEASLPDQSSGYSSELYSPTLTSESVASSQPPQPDYPPPPADSPPQEAIPPPPPFEENKTGKIIALVAGILFVLIIIIVGIKFIGGRNTTSSGPISLTYWGLWEDSSVMQPLITEYQKSHSNIKITYTKQSPKEYRERLQASLARGDGPDIFRFHNTWTDMILGDLSPMPKEAYTAADFDKTFYPVAKADLFRGGNYYGIPLEIDGLVILYNDDIVKASNITLPTNWVDFSNAAMRLTVKDSSNTIQTAGVALGSADNIEHFSDILALMMLQNGTNLKNPLGPCTDTSITTCGTDSLLFYRKFHDPPTNTWDDTLDNSIAAFAGGKVAIIFAPTWEIFTIKAINPNLNFKVAPVPQLPGITINWATYWVEGVSKRSKSQTAAWDFLKFLSSKESLTKLYTLQSKTRLFGEPYSRLDLSTSLSSDSYLGPLMQEAPTMKSFPLASNTQDNGIDDQMVKYLLDAVNSLNQGSNPQSALTTASQGFQQVLTKFGVLAAQPATQ